MELVTSVKSIPFVNLEPTIDTIFVAVSSESVSCSFFFCPSLVSKVVFLLKATFCAEAIIGSTALKIYATVGAL